MQLPSRLNRAALWSLIAFCAFSAIGLNVDESYIDSARYGKAALFGLVGALPVFVLVFLFVHLRRYAATKPLSGTVQKSLKVMGFLAAVFLGLIAVKQVRPTVVNGSFLPIDTWTSHRKSMADNSCVINVISADSAASHEYAYSYCGCIHERVREEWGYGEYLRNVESIMAKLDKENQILKCGVLAVAKHPRK